MMTAQDRRLSPNFMLSEMTASQEAARRGIDNTPTAGALVNLERLAAQLELVRSALGDSPIVISSGYRSPALNAAVKGAPGSMHVLGLAADFACPGFGSPRAACRQIIDAGIEFDQLIYEGTWVHMGLAEAGKQPRKQVLTAVFAKGQPTRYVNGLA